MMLYFVPPSHFIVEPPKFLPMCCTTIICETKYVLRVLKLTSSLLITFRTIGNKLLELLVESRPARSARRHADYELDHFCIVSTLNTEDGSGAYHAASVEPHILRLQQLIVDDGAVGGQILNHEDAVLVDVNTKVLVTNALPRVLSEDNVGTVWVTSKDKASAFEHQS